MEPEGSLPYWKQPAPGPCPEPDASNPHLSTLFPYILFDIETRSIPYSNSHTHFLSPRSFQRIRSIPRPSVTFRNKVSFYG
jgi:hypothetical protein